MRLPLTLALFPALALADGGFRRASLLENSPFAAAAHGTTPSAPLQLHGFFGAGDAIEVSIRPADGGRARWLKLGVNDDNLVLESADPVAGVAVVRMNGARLKLALAAESRPTPGATARRAYGDNRYRAGAADLSSGDTTARRQPSRATGDGWASADTDATGDAPADGASPGGSAIGILAGEPAETGGTDTAAGETTAETQPASSNDPAEPENRTGLQQAYLRAYESARAERPEFFDGSPLSHEQIAERHDYMRELRSRVRRDSGAGGR